MKPLAFHPAFFALMGLVLLPLTVSHASPPPANNVPFCQVPDFEQWERERPAAKRLADLDVGEPRTVRMIYFLPKDLQSQPDIDATFDTLIKDVQQSYAEQMENHGFGRRTFRLETDVTGKAVVHHVEGKFNDAHYHTDTFAKVLDEIDEHFDLSENIYFVVLDVSTATIDGYCGQGIFYGPESGMTLIPAPNSDRELERGWSCFNVSVAAHELGHAFGLAHDHFRNATRSPSSYHTDWMVTSFAAAEWLDAHRYFNASQSYPVRDKPTAIQMLPPSAVPPRAIRLRFEVTDSDGLHQTQLFNSTGEAVDFRGLSGEKATVEFVTPEVTEAPGNEVGLRVVDVYGNVRSNRYPIDILALLTPENVSIPDANLAAVVRETLDLPLGDAVTQLDMLRVRRLQASSRQITDSTGLEHAVNLIDLDLSGNQIRDITPLVGLIILEVLALWNNSISDIQPLIQMNNLQRLWLSGNSVSDLSPLTGLTNLKAISLRGNPVADTSPLRGLLRWNPYLEVDIDVGLPHSLTKVSGDGQEGLAGVALAAPFVVSVLDEDGAAIAGVAVTFSVTAGEGILSVTTAITDANGQARSRLTLTLGSDAETNTVEATVEGLAPETFTATAVGQAIPGSLAKVSGDGQEGTVGVALAEPFVISVLDEDGAAIAGAVVTFSVAAGGGTLSDTTATTDANGQATTTLTLGSEPGTNTVEATVEGLESVTFTATGQESSLAGFFDVFLGGGKRVALPDRTQLRQNAPNPFNSETVLSYFLLEPGPVRLEVFALSGQRVAILHQGLQQAGYHRLHWDGHDDAGHPVASGTYLYRLMTDETVLTRKLTLLR